MIIFLTFLMFSGVVGGGLYAGRNDKPAIRRDVGIPDGGVKIKITWKERRAMKAMAAGVMP